MSIKIIGSNGSNLKLITEDKIDSLINENEITYNLYKIKYNNIINDSTSNVNNCDTNYDHLLKQLINSFSIYDENNSFNHNLKKFNDLLYKLLNTTNIIEYVNIFFIQHNFLNKLDVAIKKIITKIIKKEEKNKINFIKLNNNYYLDLLILTHLLNKIKKKNSEDFNIKFNKLKTEINNLNEYIEKISIIFLKNNNKQEFDFNNCINNPKKIIYILDLYLENIKFIKGNILKIDSLINIIIEDIYNFYTIL
jgi:hypothetical protein